MANVTVTLDDALLARARREADRAGKSLSRYLADLIAAEDKRLKADQMAALEKLLALADQVPMNRPDWKFDRDEIYDSPYPGGQQRRSAQPGPSRRGEEDALRGVADSADPGKFDDGQPAGVQRNAQRRRKKT